MPSLGDEIALLFLFWVLPQATTPFDYTACHKFTGVYLRKAYMVLMQNIHAGSWRVKAGIWACSNIWLSDSQILLPHLQAWCTHEVLLQHLPLECRAIDLSMLPPDDRASAAMTRFLEQLCQQMCTALPWLDKQLTAGQLDVLDGRLMHFIARATGGNCAALPAPWAEQALQLMHCMHEVAGIPMAASQNQNPGICAAIGMHIAAAGKPALPDLQPLMPVSNNLLVDALINQPGMPSLPLLSQEAAQHRISSAEQFVDEFHWHCNRPLEPSYWTATGRYMTSEDRERAARNNQFQARHLRNYAISLQSTKYSAPAKQDSSSKPRKQAHAGGSKPKAEKKVDILRRENAKAKAAKAGNSQAQQWSSLRQQWDRVSWSENFACHVDAFVANFASDPDLYLEACAYKLQRALQHQRELVGRSADHKAKAAPNSVPATKNAAVIWQTCQAMASKVRLASKQAHKACTTAAEALAAMGFQSAASTLTPSKASASKPAQSSDSRLSLGISEARFQLAHCGDRLQEEQPAQPDPRVQTFVPDMWQRQVHLHQLIICSH